MSLKSTLSKRQGVNFCYVFPINDMFIFKGRIPVQPELVKVEVIWKFGLRGLFELESFDNVFLGK